jgi:hypothetical protein
VGSYLTDYDMDGKFRSRRQFTGDHSLYYKGCHSGLIRKILLMPVRGIGIRDITEIEKVSIKKGLPYLLYKQIMVHGFRIFAVSHFLFTFVVFQADMVRYIYFNFLKLHLKSSFTVNYNSILLHHLQN